MIIGTDLKNPPSADPVYQTLANFEMMLTLNASEFDRTRIQSDLEAIIKRTLHVKEYLKLLNGIYEKSEREQIEFLTRQYVPEESIPQILQSYEDSQSPLQ